jgi:protein involved in polysaccharide export with SLBB domain
MYFSFLLNAVGFDRRLRRTMRARVFSTLAGLIVCCLWLGSTPACAQEATDKLPPELGTSDTTYKLVPGDKIKISIFNQPDLSGEFQLDGEGRIFLPLIGRVEASDLTAAELEKVLVDRFKPDYLVNPRIFIQVGMGNLKPYYLMGEVKGAGAFPYVTGMTYLTAIANAGGYTYRAKQDYVYVIRADDPEQKEIKLSVEEKVQPGDIIRIAERLF